MSGIVSTSPDTLKADLVMRLVDDERVQRVAIGVDGRVSLPGASMFQRPHAPTRDAPLTRRQREDRWIEQWTSPASITT